MEEQSGLVKFPHVAFQYLKFTLPAARELQVRGLFFIMMRNTKQ